MKEQRFDLIYNGANLMKVDSKDGNFIPVSALAERDKLIDEMVKWIDDADFWSAAERFQARAEVMRGGEK